MPGGPTAVLCSSFDPSIQTSSWCNDLRMKGISEKANEVALAYGPALTKAIADGDLTTFKEYVFYSFDFAI